MSVSYDPWLVLLSLVVASFASYTALDLATRITASRGHPAAYWLIGGAFSMGTGIWAMHFIGMLAFSIGVPMTYDVGVTLASMLIAVVVSGFALYTVSRELLTRRKLLAGGVLMGFGIAAMHYSGMAAMDMQPPVRYDPWLVAASVAIAVAAALAALWIAFTLRDHARWMAHARLGSALVMGLAVTGMHYTGMAAAIFAPGTVCTGGPLVDSSWLAGTIAMVTVLILCGTLLLSVLDARAAMRSASMARSLHAANRELEHLALHDSLTRLPNRRLLEDRIEHAIAHAKRAGGLCALLFLDLDRFKSVNDSLGHTVGDELLKAVAERLRKAVRAEDTVSRLAGDEFVILLHHLAVPEHAGAVAGKLLETLNSPYRLPGLELYVTPSIGISLYPDHGQSPQALLTYADTAMYEAKKAGRNNVQLAEAGSAMLPERFVLENDMRGALARGEFEIHYQPKISLHGGELIGMEALLRWRHPRRGMVSPAEFIPIAEESGLILPLGQWVLRQACLQNKAWQAQ